RLGPPGNRGPGRRVRAGSPGRQSRSDGGFAVRVSGRISYFGCRMSDFGDVSRTSSKHTRNPSYGTYPFRVASNGGSMGFHTASLILPLVLAAQQSTTIVPSGRSGGAPPPVQMT